MDDIIVFYFSILHPLPGSSGLQTLPMNSSDRAKSSFKSDLGIPTTYSLSTDYFYGIFYTSGSLFRQFIDLWSGKD